MLSNLEDQSVILMSAVSYTVNDSIFIKSGVNYTYGDSGDQYTPNGSHLMPYLTVTFGEMNF
jgi:hypothetical protein